MDDGRQEARILGSVKSKGNIEVLEKQYGRRLLVSVGVDRFDEKGTFRAGAYTEAQPAKTFPEPRGDLKRCSFSVWPISGTEGRFVLVDADVRQRLYVGKCAQSLYDTAGKKVDADQAGGRKPRR
jgi:hypothetical protein